MRHCQEVHDGSRRPHSGCFLGDARPGAVRLGRIDDAKRNSIAGSVKSPEFMSVDSDGPRVGSMTWAWELKVRGTNLEAPKGASKLLMSSHALALMGVGGGQSRLHLCLGEGVTDKDPGQERFWLPLQIHYESTSWCP